MSVPNLPKLNLSTQPATTLADVLARIKVKLPGVAVPVPAEPPKPTPDSPREAPIITSVPLNVPTSQPGANVTKHARKNPPSTEDADTPLPTAYAYLFVCTEEGEKWRKDTIEKLYPKLAKCLLSTRRVLLSPLARFQLLELTPPVGVLIPCESHELWSEAVGEKHGEFLGRLS